MKHCLLTFTILFVLLSSKSQTALNSNVILPYQQNCKYGLMDVSGKIITTAQYQFISRLYDSLYLTQSAEKQDIKGFGLISKSGRTVIPFNYDTITCMFYKSEDPKQAKFIFVAAKGAQQDYYDAKGSILQIDKIATEQFDVNNKNLSFQSSLLFKEANKYGVKKNGQTMIDPIYDSIVSIGDYFFIAKKGKQYGILELSGEPVYPFGDYQITYNKSLFGFIITNYSTGLKGFYASAGFQTECLFTDIYDAIYGKYVLVSRTNACKFYYDTKTKKEFIISN